MKAKVKLNLAKVQSLFGPLMLALIGISNVNLFWVLMYINGSIKALEQLLNLFMSICSRGLLLQVGFFYGSGGRSFSKIQ
jgi:hypothetical protein